MFGINKCEQNNDTEAVKKNFSQKDHYFKIDRRILDIESTKDLSKSELRKPSRKPTTLVVGMKAY